jgi:hypothetical protein
MNIPKVKSLSGDWIMNFEKEVIRILLRKTFSPGEISETIGSVNRATLEETGYGYYLTGYFQKEFPPDWDFCFHEPIVCGGTKENEMLLGFVIYLRKTNILIEGHGWGDSVEIGIRESILQVFPVKNEAVP